MRGRLLTSLLALALIFGVRPAAAAEQKIGFVDMQRALQATSTGKKAKADLEKQYEIKKTELQKREAELKKMDEDLRRQSAALSKDALAKKAQALQSEAMKFQRDVSEAQGEFQKKTTDLSRPILEKLATSLEKIAKQDGYTMVFEKGDQNVLFAKKEVDLTDAVITDYEANLSKK